MSNQDKLSLSNEALLGLLRATLARGAFFRFRAKGFSMSPFVKDGDIVTVAPIDSSRIFGGVAAFVRPDPNRLVLHRIVGNRRNGYFMKGDGCLAIDGFVLRDNVIGIVTKVERDDREVRAGLGPERYLIALLSPYGILPFIWAGWRAIPLSIRKFLKCKMAL